MNANPRDSFAVAPGAGLSVDQYRRFWRDGFLVVEQLLSPDEIGEVRRHADDVVDGRLSAQRSPMPDRDLRLDTGTTCQRLEAPPAGVAPADRAGYFVRIHMLHRVLELHERYLLHPRVLDVIQSLIGSDVLALSTMLFFKPPGKPGQDWHQDSFYIPTYPDTLCGVWIAIDDCDHANGALQVASGSGVEPVFPPASGYGFGNTHLTDIPHGSARTEGAQSSELARAAAAYPCLTMDLKAGSGIFFGGRLLHRSTPNVTTDRMRRSLAFHYCSARSLVRWGADQDERDVHAAPIVDPRTRMTNGSHILARGDTHLPFARPLFGTACAALEKLSAAAGAAGT